MVEGPFNSTCLEKVLFHMLSGANLKGFTGFAEDISRLHFQYWELMFSINGCSCIFFVFDRVVVVSALTSGTAAAPLPLGGSRGYHPSPSDPRM